ncbi:MAG: AMP-binding protein, partial [bacterium]|nr:AMP-binding protein [bacterium]
MSSNKTIQARLVSSFEKNSSAIAIEYKDHSLSYEKLDRSSNYIANWLAGENIKKGTFIGIMVESKAALITAILGIIKAGCVFVPLDSHYPEKRTESMLSVSEIPYVFTGTGSLETLKRIRRHLPQRLDIITFNEEYYENGDPLNPVRHNELFKLNESEKTRYKRQILLDGWGLEGQERLKAAKVFVAGAGGSGSPLIQQLALCGFGNIVICDFDDVELSNLNRQSLHDETRIGMNKALSAKKTVERMNPNINVIPCTEKITRENVFQLVGDCEIIFDNVDSLEAKSYLSECAVAKGIPHMISSMIHINSYACVFHTPHSQCFFCLYDKNRIEDIKKARSMTKHYEINPNSVASPSLYLSTGFVVNEAVKILLGMGEPAYNKYFHFNQYGPGVSDTSGFKQITFPFNDHFRALTKKQGFDWERGWSGKFVEEIAVEPDPQCPVCGKHNRNHHQFAQNLNDIQDEWNGQMEHKAHIPPAVNNETVTNETAEIEETPLPHYYETQPEVDVLPEDVLNIYFTSGTTGKPKAVLGRNIGLTHFVAWEIKEFGLEKNNRVSQLTSQCHDPY